MTGCYRPTDTWAKRVNGEEYDRTSKDPEEDGVILSEKLKTIK